mmetsp:Transcript_57737/g.108195  ORF Transcript_57737/g.108195 Transcript_57737/m.108195 type:complete len:221 (+) Transcript_57737:55-717(+)
MSSSEAIPEEEAGGPIEEIAELQIKEEARLEKLFAEQRSERGLDDETTLHTFFKLFDMWIQLYRLNKCMEVLPEVVPICRSRGGDFHVKGVQALAFTLWKKSQFKDAVKLFHEIEDLIGLSAALCENMGHTYSSMGNYDQASEYFKRALLCLDKEEELGKKNRRSRRNSAGSRIDRRPDGQIRRGLGFCQRVAGLVPAACQWQAIFLGSKSWHVDCQDLA